MRHRDDAFGDDGRLRCFRQFNHGRLHHASEKRRLELREKRNGKPIAAKARPKGENVVDLMDALKRSIANDRGAEPAKGKEATQGRSGTKRNAAANQREARCQG
jgi:non-homologous end joining protein Ku